MMSLFQKLFSNRFEKISIEISKRTILYHYEYYSEVSSGEKKINYFLFEIHPSYYFESDDR